MAEIIEHDAVAVESAARKARRQQVARWRLLWRHAARFSGDFDVAPPVPLDDLLRMTDDLAESKDLRVSDEQEKAVLSIMIHNELWRETVAAVPFSRRLLLLPQCLRSRDDCRAETDAYGLLCRDCGQCPLGRLQREAVALGYVVLIAEGTGVVTGLLKEGSVDAVLGTSCLPALEKSFRHLAEEAIPSLAIPLLRNGCNATDVDLELLLHHIRMQREPAAYRTLSVEAWRERVRAWFLPTQLEQVIPPSARHAMRMAVEWLSGAGKRWRPLLAAAVHDAVQDTAEPADPELIRTVAVAAECFHKASLVHDDIEDGDAMRYGRPTLHCAYGIPAALNAGDLLLGEGYRLLTHCPVAPAVRLRMLDVATDAHRRLCLGQGEELQWRRKPTLLDVRAVLDLFRLKTAPAFEVAILLGALSGGADEATCATLSRFSRALGVAYQIRDDLQDAEEESGKDGVKSPGILFGLLCGGCAENERAAMLDALRRGQSGGHTKADWPAWYRRYDVAAAARGLQADYRARALRELAPIRSIRLKSVLTRLVKRILP